MRHIDMLRSMIDTFDDYHGRGQIDQLRMAPWLYARVFCELTELSIQPGYVPPTLTLMGHKLFSDCEEPFVSIKKRA